MQIKSWTYLIVGIIALAAFGASNPHYGKWLLLIVIAGALLMYGQKVANRAVGD